MINKTSQRMSPTLNESSVLKHFEHSSTIEIRNRIMFDFYSGLPLIYINALYREIKQTKC